VLDKEMDHPSTRLNSLGRINVLNDGPRLSSSGAIKGWLGVIAIVIGMLLSGCGGVILVGAGVGAGAFSYIYGNVIRVYEAEYQDGIEASSQVMEQLVFKGKEETEDGLRTVIEGYFDYDTPVTIEVVFVEPGSTQIGVRTGYIGNNNLEISEQLHAEIASELTKSGLPKLKATSQKRKMSEPRTVQTTSEKNKVQPEESESRVPRSLYEDLPPPPKGGSTSTTVEQDTLSINSEQDTQTPPTTENEQEMTELFQTEATEIKGGAESPTAERSVAPVGSVSSSTRNEPEDTFSIDFAQESQSPQKSQDEKDFTEQLQARVTEMEDEVEIPVSVPVPDRPDIDIEKTEEMQQQELQTRIVPETEDIIFTYQPESELTIHSGAYSVLDEVVAYLDDNPSSKLDIRAYINSSSNKEREIALTQKRVYDIRTYLILKGISEERISAQGLGDNNFPEINNLNRQKSQDHLVEMMIR
jgi:outer membrane protein OmpA-like peptidoglycan-associated protein